MTQSQALKTELIALVNQLNPAQLDALAKEVSRIRCDRRYQQPLKV